MMVRMESAGKPKVKVIVMDGRRFAGECYCCAPCFITHSFRESKGVRRRSTGKDDGDGGGKSGGNSGEEQLLVAVNMSGKLNRIADQPKESIKKRWWLSGEQGLAEVKALLPFVGRVKVKTLIGFKPEFFFLIFFLTLVCKGAKFLRSEWLETFEIKTKVQAWFSGQI